MIMKSLKDIEEIWKPINLKEFKHLYEVSSLGRVRSVDHYSDYRIKGFKMKIKGRVLKPKLSNKGYLEVILSDGPKKKCCRVHQLVAKTFLPNPNNYSIINHINEVKTDNRIENLEWCTHKYNSEEYHRSRTLIYKYDLKGNFICTFNLITEAALSVDGDKTGINHCCNGNLKTYKGFIWTKSPLTKEDYLFRISDENKEIVLQYSLDGKHLNTFNSMKDAAEFVGCNSSAISMACCGLRKTIKGYIWKKLKV